MYKKVGLLVAIFISSFYFTGCATIVRGSNANFNINSEPSSAKVTIVDLQSDRVILERNTPFSVKLKRKAKYFDGKEYQVIVEKQGYNRLSFDIKPEVGGWYIAGNFFSWFLLGWVIVDPLTGAMWNLIPEESDQVNVDGKTITVKLLSNLTQEQRSRMVRIN